MSNKPTVSLYEFAPSPVHAAIALTDAQADLIHSGDVEGLRRARDETIDALRELWLIEPSFCLTSLGLSVQMLLRRLNEAWNGSGANMHLMARHVPRRYDTLMPVADAIIAGLKGSGEGR